MVDKKTGIVHGYHFHVRFIPRWSEVARFVVARARALGLRVSDDGHELEPRATSLAFVGTRWTRFTHGGLRFDVLEERKDLGQLVLSAGNSGEHPTYAFGVANRAGLHGPFNEYMLEVATGLWLRQGSLTLRPWEDAELGEEVIAEFQVWTGLEALARVAQGEPALGRPSSGTAVVTKHAAPVWAPEFQPSIAHRDAEVRATFSSSRMTVSVQVDLMIEGGGSSLSEG
jgi:hypothetical protein